MTTGEKIAALRREKGLSQEALGERLGLSRQAVSKWEADQAVPTMDNLVELSRLFGVPVDTLLRPEEELPGKGKEIPEKGTRPADGGRSSRAPALTKKAKWFLVALAVLALASGLANLWAAARMRAMQEELSALHALVDDLQADAHTALRPDEQQADGTSAELTDAQVQYMLAPDAPEQLIVTLSALPREVNAEDTAKFVIRSGEESWSCATWLDGVYSGQIKLPLCDSFSAYLVLTDREGTVRNLLIGSEYGVRDRFSFTVDAVCAGAIQNDAWKGTFVEGVASVSVLSPGVNSMAGNSIYPVRMRIVLRKNGQELEAMELDVSSAWDTDAEKNGDYALHFTPALHWQQLDAEKEALTLQVELTDNYGRVTTYPCLT